MPRPDPEEDLSSMDREEYATEARMERQASRMRCGACSFRGTHRAGCPEDNEQESSDE